jgi:hypothetical protein
MLREETVRCYMESGWSVVSGTPQRTFRNAEGDFFFFQWYWGFELRVLSLLDKFSTTGVTPSPPLFALVIFQIGSYAFFQSQPWNLIFLTTPPR